MRSWVSNVLQAHLCSSNVAHWKPAIICLDTLIIRIILVDGILHCCYCDRQVVKDPAKEALESSRHVCIQHAHENTSRISSHMLTRYSSSILVLNALACASVRDSMRHSTLHCSSTLMYSCIPHNTLYHAQLTSQHFLPTAFVCR